MKVLQVNKFFYVKGGSEAYLFSLIEGLKARSISVAEFAMHDVSNYPSDYKENFVSTVDYDTDNLLKKVKYAGRVLYSFEAKKKISRLLDAFNPDIVHLHLFQHQISSSILPEIKKRGIPIVYTAHDLKSICPNYKMLTHGRVCEDCLGHKYYKCIQNKCVKDSYLKSLINSIEMYSHRWLKFYDLIDLIITPSDFYRKKLIQFRFAENKVVHLPNFVDQAQFPPHYEHENYFIYLGRLSEEKGVLTLVEAMADVSNGKLVIIGTGPLENQIRKKISFLGLKNVELAGFQTGKALNDYITKAMFSVMPSEWYENGPISLLESFACGKPVVGSGIGGIPEHIKHGKDGLIFKVKDVKDLAEKINMLLGNSDLLASMAKCASKKIMKRYNKDRHIDTMVRIYEKMIS